MILTKACFLVCVGGNQLLTAVMLPNTKHIAPESRANVINRHNDVIGFHNSKKVTTGHLCLLKDDDQKRSVVIYSNSPNKPVNIPQQYLAFQKCKKRFLAHDLMDVNGQIKPLHPKQKEYLDSQIITHAWAALHKGHVVGLITYPYLKSHQMHDLNFTSYQSIARKALQTVGYVVSCDVVLDKSDQLRIYNIHSTYERKVTVGRKRGGLSLETDSASKQRIDKTFHYFTRELPRTSHLSFNAVLQNA